MASAELGVVIGFRSFEDARMAEAALAEAGIRVLSAVTSAGGLLRDAQGLSADVLLVDPRIEGFYPGLIRELLHGGERPVPCVGLIPPGYDPKPLYDEGLMGHVAVPLDDVQARRLVPLTREAAARAHALRAAPDYVPEVSRAVSALAAQGGWRKSIIAFWSPDGGVGKSTLAVNSAVMLALVGGRPVILLDLDMSRAAAHVLLGLSEERNLFGLFSELLLEHRRTGRAACPPHLLQKYLQPFGKGGKLHVLVGVPGMHLAGREEFRGDEERTIALTRALLEAAYGMADFVIIDLGPDANLPLHYAALERADLVLVVARPDAVCANSLARVLPVLRKAFGDGVGKFELLLNMWREDVGIRMREFVEVVGLKKFGEIPFDPQVPLQNNLGKPYALEKPGPWSDALASLLAVLYPPLAPIWTHRGGRLSGPAAGLARGGRSGGGLWGRLRRGG